PWPARPVTAGPAGVTVSSVKCNSSPVRNPFRQARIMARSSMSAFPNGVHASRMASEPENTATPAVRRRASGGHARSPGPCVMVAIRCPPSHSESRPSPTSVYHPEAEHVADRHLAGEAESSRALDDQAELVGAEGARIVEMDVHAHAVARSDPEDDIEVTLGIAVETRGIDAADQIGATLHRAVEELGGTGPVDDTALGKGHD